MPEDNSKNVPVSKAKGRPMLRWVGKKPLDRLPVFPAQKVETFVPKGAEKDNPNLLFHGDNKEVLSWLLANGYRETVDLIYIDPPFNTGADSYVRNVRLRGLKMSRVQGEDMSPIEQIQYANSFFADLFLQFMYERMLLLRELLSATGIIVVRIDYHYGHYLKILLDEIFGKDFFVNEILVSRQRENVGSTNKFEVTTESLFVYSKSKDFTFNKPRVDRSVANIQWTAFLMGGERNPPERVFMGLKLLPPAGQHFSLKQEKVDKLLGERFLRLKCNSCGAVHYCAKSQEELERYMRKKEHRFKFYDLYAGKDYFGISKLNKCSSCGKKKFSVEYLGSDEEAVRNNWTDISSYSQRSGYPTENSEELLKRVIDSFSNPGNLVLDCFVGSGTTVAVAQKLRRRWLACDINKGSIQTTSKRLQATVESQTKNQQRELIDRSVYSFDILRVNDYDLQIQHNEALDFALEHVGVSRSKTDLFFDGTLGSELVKVVPLQHACTLLDIQLIEDELKNNRKNEDRNVVIVCLGKEAAVDTKVEQYNKTHPVNKLRVIELRTDKKYGKFFEHKPCTVDVIVEKKGDRIHVRIKDFLSPTIIERLSNDEGILSVKIDDWRSMVDTVLVDTDYDGEVFNIVHSDVPEKKNDVVEGIYEIEAPKKGATVAVKIIDMLGEELLVTKKV